MKHAYKHTRIEKGKRKDRFNIIKIHGVDWNVSYVTFVSRSRQGWPINAVCGGL